MDIGLAGRHQSHRILADFLATAPQRPVLRTPTWLKHKHRNWRSVVSHRYYVVMQEGQIIYGQARPMLNLPKQGNPGPHQPHKPSGAGISPLCPRLSGEK